MCGSTSGGLSVDGVNLTREAVIQGVVTRGAQPVSGAYVRLLDRDGEFTAEVPTSDAGQFRFFAGPGPWTIRVLAPGATADRQVMANTGAVVDVEVMLQAE